MLTSLRSYVCDDMPCDCVHRGRHTQREPAVDATLQNVKSAGIGIQLGQNLDWKSNEGACQILRQVLACLHKTWLKIRVSQTRCGPGITSHLILMRCRSRLSHGSPFLHSTAHSQVAATQQLRIAQPGTPVTIEAAESLQIGRHS
jgi:hypothetical protein